VLNTAGAGTGWMLTDNHGEIPFPVSDDVLSTIAETVRSSGHATGAQGRIDPGPTLR
jgi:hypothetical protein